MKKMYITPEVEINETQVEQMMALSIIDGGADGSEVLVEEENDVWNIWGEEEEDF